MAEPSSRQSHSHHGPVFNYPWYNFPDEPESGLARVEGDAVSSAISGQGTDADYFRKRAAK